MQGKKNDKLDLQELTKNLKSPMSAKDPSEVVAEKLLKELELVLKLRREPIKLGSPLHNALQRIYMHIEQPFISRREVACVFDGVIHPKVPLWIDPHAIPNPPIAGAFLWLTELVEHFTVHVVSHRAKRPEGVKCIQEWFLHWGLDPGVLGALFFPPFIPDVHVLIDDRCIKFDGTYPLPEELDDFSTWYDTK